MGFSIGMKEECCEWRRVLASLTGPAEHIHTLYIDLLVALLHMRHHLIDQAADRDR